jgi:hypothetical protein
MQVRRLGILMVAAVLVAGVSAGVARADGTDPQGKFQAPTNGGTPGVGNEFDLAPFGTTAGGCTFDGTNEDCVLKNQSSNNWTWVQITAGADIPCGDISFTTTLFLNENCTNDPTTGDPTIYLSGVNYSPENLVLFSSVSALQGACVPSTDPTCTPTHIQTELIDAGPPFALNCTPSGGFVPGVLMGCDFEVLLSPGPDDTGTWPTGTPFSVVAPEPSTIGLILTGIIGLPFARRRKAA